MYANGCGLINSISWYYVIVNYSDVCTVALFKQNMLTVVGWVTWHLGLCHCII